MTLDEQIKLIDLQLLSQKIVINSNYGSINPYINTNAQIINTWLSLKYKKESLLKRKERKEKLEKLNENR